MRKVAKKILAVCLSAVMAGSMLSVAAFATGSETISDEEHEIATLESSTVIKKDKTKTDWSVSGNVYIEKGATLTLEGTNTINGDVYVFGTLRNNGSLTVSGTLHCLHYNSMLSAGDYDYGYFINAGSVTIHAIDATAGWLDTEIPDTDDDDDDDDDDGDDGDNEPETGGGAFNGRHVTVISGDEEKNDWVTSGVVYIPKDASLTTTGDVTIYGDVYVVGTLTNTGTFTVTGTIYCLHYNNSLSAGDYDYGYVYNRGGMIADTMVVKDYFLSINFPTSSVHIWDSGEVIVEHTCTEPGLMLYTCTVCGETITEDIPAEHTWGDVEWTWSDDHSSATASRTCEICDFKETLDATVTSETTDPTETEDGSIVYTATVTLEDGSELTTTYDEILPATGQENSNSSGSGSSNSGSTSSGSSGSGSTSSGSSSSGSSSSDSSGSGSSGSDSSDSGSSSSDSSDSSSSGSGSSGSDSSGSGYSGSGSSGSGTSGSGSSGSSGSSTYSPQTDDPTNMTALWLIVAAFGLAGCAVLVLYKVRGFRVRN